MSRFGHGHSFAGGALVSLSLQRHALAVLLAVFMLGCLTGRFWAAGADLARTALQWGRARGGRRRFEREIPF